MSGAEPDDSFKITDRRRRSPDSAEAPRIPAREAFEPSPSRPREASEPSVSRRSPVTSGPAPAADSPSGADVRSLIGLFVMLGSTAAAALGSPHPVTGETHRDPVEAASLIDLLCLLRERTEGHRTPEETRVLDELIYDLQLRYVELTRRSG